MQSSEHPSKQHAAKKYGGSSKCEICGCEIENGKQYGVPNGKPLCKECFDDTIFETTDTKIFSIPSKSEHAFRILFNFEHLKNPFGKWMVFDHYDKIDGTWDRIRTAIARRELRGCFAKCSTIRYDPTTEGPGPSTSAVICVYTTEKNIDNVGRRLIRIVKRDIIYKTNKDTRDYKYTFAGYQEGTPIRLFWNKGRPGYELLEGCRPSYATSRHRKDEWHINVAKAPEPLLSSRKVDGYWILRLENKELTKLWHHLRSFVESRDKNFGILEMICPSKQSRSSPEEKPVFIAYTNKEDYRSVGKELIKVVQRDIEYAREGQDYSTPDDKEILHWKEGETELSAFQSCVSSLSALARTFLEKSLDWEKNDLNEITRHTFAWEGTLLGLTDEEIHDIKTKHPENYKLQCLEALQKWKVKEGSEATYGNLLMVFTQAGYQAVANSICEILGGKCEEVEFVEAVNNAVMKSGEITRRHAHSIFVGPPGSGKSSSIERLLKKKLQKKGFSPSTGVCESLVMVHINPSTFHSAAVLSDATWEEEHYEVSWLKQVTQEGQDMLLSEEVAPVQEAVAENAMSKFEPAYRISQPPNDAPQPIQGHTSEADYNPSPKHDGELVASASSSKESVAVVAMPKQNILELIRKHGIKPFKNYLQKTSSLYLRDTGGQVEFQEMLPLIIFGPSIFFFVFRVDLDFQSKFSVEYRIDKEDSLNSYKSSITTEQALLQCLGSVYAMEDTLGGTTSKPLTSLVFIIGTHTDQVQPADRMSKLAELNRHIDQLIKNNGFKHFVQYFDDEKEEVIFPVNNMSSDDTDFKPIRSKVSSLVSCRPEFAVTYPVSYLVVCLNLQAVKQSILTLSEFRSLAATQGIEGDKVFHLLRFLHLRVGIVRYYNVDGLRDIVVIQPQILFNTITDLVVRTYSCKALKTQEIREYKNEGVFTQSVFECVEEEAKKGILPSSAFDSHDKRLSPETFLQLLVHLRIIAPLSTDDQQEQKFFIPCVLNHVPESSIERPPSDVNPLAITFACSHCPKGIFGVLVTHLIRPDPTKRDNFNTTFTIIQDQIFKDHVSFKVDSMGLQDEISLRLFPTYLEVSFFPSKGLRVSPKEVVCNNIRQILQESLRRSLKDLHYNEDKVKPAMSIQCNTCSRLHPVNDSIHCCFLYCPTANESIPLSDQARCWYYKGKSKKSSAAVLPAILSAPTPDAGIPTLPKFIRFPTSSAGTMNLAEKISTRYEEFGILLLEDDDGSLVAAIVEKHREKAEKINREIFCHWLRGRGKQPVSWHTLAHVLRDIGMDRLAKLITDNI